MGSDVAVCFYLVIGFAVAVAIWLTNDSKHSRSPVFQIITAPLFWPIYIPVLLTRSSIQAFPTANGATSLRPNNTLDEMTTQIAQAERELDTALRSLDGWVEGVLAGEQHRIAELRTAWHQQARQIREIDQLLNQTSTEKAVTSEAQTESAPSPSANPLAASETAPSAVAAEPIAEAPRDDPNRTRISQCEISRSENMRKLKAVRSRMHDDLICTLAWVRELVTMIHLAKYTGAPASRALELVQQIAAAVEGVSEVHKQNSQFSN